MYSKTILNLTLLIGIIVFPVQGARIVRSFKYLLLEIFINYFTTPPSQISRIVQGFEAAENQFPYQTYIRIYEPSGVVHICGGSIISRNFVLTARHCVAIGELYEIHAGSIIRQSQPVVVKAYKSHLHPLYDVAVIELEQPLTFSDNVSPVRLPPRSWVERDLTDRKAIVSGFGFTSESSGFPSRLLYAPQRIMSFADCKEIYGSNVNIENMCTESAGKNVCYGDSGGPLVLTEDEIVFQIGTVSYGADRGCDAGYPSGFVQTTFILDFIAKVTDVIIED